MVEGKIKDTAAAAAPAISDGAPVAARPARYIQSSRPLDGGSRDINVAPRSPAAAAVVAGRSRITVVTRRRK